MTEGRLTAPLFVGRIEGERVSPGDRRAFLDLVRPHLARLHRYACRLCADENAGADLAQDALVKAYERISSYDPARPILPWLLALVRNTFIDRVRSFDPLRAAADAVDGDLSLPSPGDGPERARLAVERRRMVDAALARIPVDQRSALILFHVEGLSLEEVAEAEGVAVGTVKSRLFRGRAAMADLLKDRGI